LTPEHWRRLEEIYHAALARGESERTAFLADACAGDEALRREVESLLDQPTSADGFLDGPALAIAARMLGEGADPDNQPTITMLPTAVSPHVAPGAASRLAPGQRFGPYRIERLLGRGGMGEVYEAEHLEHGRRIALKVLSQGLSDATDRARFLREGQLAAAVSHPHSVYVYGSEEIAGIPVIAMELLPGGTLKDRVEETGPLAPVEATDAILQVVSGLEAAQAAGILHRDIKPSNCFLDADGTVKVGDFGLSIPTVARDVTQLTTTGTIHATPQFASPEQLRGQQLDVRSDIYAVGATLHYLLTGRPPFDDRNLIALVSRIATEPPVSPREVRPEVPRALAAVVLECLAKDPAHRPASYRVLANVLEPLGSTVKTPAPLGIRTAAFVFDDAFSILLPLNILAGYGGVLRGHVVFVNSSSLFSASNVVGHLLLVAYFAITEGVWGASLGKALCGFRVVTESGARPRFARALLRALVFVLPGWLASGLVQSIAGFGITTAVVEIVVLALLFVTARRANGFAGIHEWVTHTRTVLKSAVGVHGPVQPAPSPIEVPASPRWVGPYRIADTSSLQPNSAAALGYDERLRRTVWLRFPEVDSDPVPHVRRILRRPARLRWLAGQRTSGLAWDAYEQVPGQPVDTWVMRPQSWGTVRGWLCDLAEEMHAGLRDGSLPALELDRVWIGNDGRARLLDWPAPNDHPDLADSPLPRQAVDLPQAERFLYLVAVSALEGHVLADTHSHVRTPRVPLPMPATDCLAKLGEQRFTTSEEMLTALMSAARGSAAISRTKRAVHLSLCAIPTIFMLVGGLFQIFVASRQARPDLAELAACLNRLAAMENRGVLSTNPQYRALEVYIAGRHRDLISNSSTWSTSLFEPVASQRRALAERVVATLPSPQEADVDEAVRLLRPFLDNVKPGVESGHPHVRFVSTGEAADRAGVEADDVVVAVNGELIRWASQLRDAIAKHPDQLITLSILRDGQPLMIRATPARIANQGWLGIRVENEALEMSLKVAWRVLWVHAIAGLMVAGTLGLLSALAARGGIALRLMSIAVVTKNGTLASGSRTWLRAVLSWLPVLAASAAAFAGHSPLLTLTPQAEQFFAISLPNGLPSIFFPNEPSILVVRVAIITVALAVFALAVVFALMRPERGLQDHLAGTWLVPR